MIHHELQLKGSGSSLAPEQLHSARWNPERQGWELIPDNQEVVVEPDQLLEAITVADGEGEPVQGTGLGALLLESSRRDQLLQELLQ